MSANVKIVALCVVGVGVVSLAKICHDCLKVGHEAKQNEYDRAMKIKLEEIKKEYPPEYWTAKAEEAKAKAETDKARIESEERLKIDERIRRDAEIAAKREFEKDAPAEYWEQRRIEQEEQTKREADRRRYEAEKESDRMRYEAETESARLHKQAIEASAKAAERALKNQFGYSTGLLI